MAPEIQASTRWWHGSLIEISGNRSVHGLCYLPKGYTLALVPPNTPLKFNIPNRNASLTTPVKSDGRAWSETLSSSYSFPRIIISLLQLLYSTTTLYRARGSQIEEYGYAAFGLTVAPFAFMSLVNIIGNLLTPSYPSMYLVASDRMEEARNDGGFFDGMVGCIDPQKLVSNSADMRSAPWSNKVAIYYLPMALVPFFIVVGLSRLHQRNSTALQAGFTLSWLIVSTAWGGIPGYKYGFCGATQEADKDDGEVVKWTVFLISSVPAIGVFVVVGQMLKSYGNCVRID